MKPYEGPGQGDPQAEGPCEGETPMTFPKSEVKGVAFNFIINHKCDKVVEGDTLPSLLVIDLHQRSCCGPESSQ